MDERTQAPPRRDAAPVRASTLRVLADRNFGPYFAGNLLSNCGTWFQNIAQAILVYRLTRSAFLVGVVNFAQFAGVFVLAPWSGSAADRFDRRRLLVATQLGAMAVTGALAVLAWSGRASTPVVIAFALALGMTNAFAIPAMQALVPLLVDRANLAPAVALNGVTFNLARAVGPVLGALVVARLGIPWAFALNCASYAALIAGLGVVHPSPQAPAPSRRPRLADGLREVVHDVRLTALFGVVAVVSLSADPVNTLTPAFATRVLHRPDTLAGYLVGAFGAGSVTAAFFVAGRTRRSYAQLAFTLALLGAGIAGFAASRTLPMALTALFVGGLGFLASVTAATTVLQLEVDDAMRGRIMALWSVAFLGLRPLGSLADGAVASAAGVRIGALTMAIPALTGAAAMLALRRTERR